MATNYENSTQKTGSVAGKECLCTTEEMLKIKKQYQSIVNCGRAVGANWAAQMLQHWMNGSGKDMIIKMEVLRRFGQVKAAEETIRDAMEEARKKSSRMIVETIKDGEEKKYYIYSHQKITGLPWSELFYASGTNTLTGRLLLRAKRRGDVITMVGTLEFHWWDPYDWHAGLTAFIPCPGAGTIADADADKYENAGCAKKFDMYSFWNQTFSETYTIDDILWFKDTDTIEWGEISEGRPSVLERGSWLEWDTHDKESQKGIFQGGRYLPGIALSKEEKANRDNSNPAQRRDRRERTRENSRREDRRRR